MIVYKAASRIRLQAIAYKCYCFCSFFNYDTKLGSGKTKVETVWAMQKAMATLFDVDRSLITKHLKNIFDYRELIADRVCVKFAHTAEDCKTYNTMFCLRSGLKAQQAHSPGQRPG